MWQSRVEIEQYSIVQLTVLPRLKRCCAKLPLRAGLIHAAKMHEYLISLCTCMSPTFNGSSALQHFERGNAVKICNGIMFDFYLGLPHMYVCMYVGMYVRMYMYRSPAQYAVVG